MYLLPTKCKKKTKNNKKQQHILLNQLTFYQFMESPNDYFCIEGPNHTLSLCIQPSFLLHKFFICAILHDPSIVESIKMQNDMIRIYRLSIWNGI